MNIAELHKKFLNECNSKISIDTRKITSGSLFFALRGDTYDAHAFAKKALDLGCAYVVISDPEYKISEKYILAHDVLETLQELAHFHRKTFNIPVIGLTGSNGKTTTKELLAAVLGTKKTIVATKGNFNNHIGVPLTLLDINEATDIAIIEMGANHVGEIARLCEITAPTHGIITNIGRAHLGLFDGFDGVVRAKTELYRYLENHSGVSFVNGLDSLLLNKSNTLGKITYLSSDSVYPVKSLKTNPFVSLLWRDNSIISHLTGQYNIMNIAAAISIGDYFGIDELNIKKGIESYVPENSRSEVVTTKNKNTLIKDYYNANTSSMDVALQNLESIETNDSKIAILGDMFELGEYEDEDHNFILEKAVGMNIDKIILVGKAFSRCIHDYKNIFQYETTDQAVVALRELNIKDSLILLKASNGMNFKRIFNKIEW